MALEVVDFGYDFSSKLRGNFEGVGFSPKNSGMTSGDFIGFVTGIGNTNYLVTQIKEGSKDVKVGKIDVHRCLYDMFSDGNGILYIDELHSFECEQLEAKLNNPDIKKKILEDYCYFEKFAGDCYCNSLKYIVTNANIKVNAIVIKHDVFERKENLLKCYSKSFSELQEELESVHKKKIVIGE